MRQIIALLCLGLLVMLDHATAQPLKVRYSIYAAVSDTAHTVTGFERIYLENNSGQPLSAVVIKLYANAYAGDSSNLSESLLQKGDLRFYFAKPQERGGYQSIAYKVGEKKLIGEPLQPYGEVTRLRLPEPLAVGDSTSIDITFLLKLPKNFIGFGVDHDLWMLRHWHPQLAAFSSSNQWDLTPLGPGPDKTAMAAVFDVHLVAPAADQVLASRPAIDQETMNAQEDGNTNYHYRFSHATEFQALVKKNGNNEAASRLPEGIFSGSTAAVVQKGYFDAFSEGAGTNTDSMSAAALFTRLLPGPLKGKRPLDPTGTLKQIQLAANGIDYRDQSLAVKPAFLMNLRETDKYHYLSVLPALGYNHYDQVMAGIMVHNYQLPERPFDFLLAPMIGTKSKTLTGLSRFAYNIRKPGSWWQVSLDASSYDIGHYDAFQDLNEKEVPGGFKHLWRVVPAVHFTAYPDIYQKNRNWGLDLRGIWLRRKDWQVTGETFTMAYKNQLIGELKAHLEDRRKLYPYRLEMKLDGTEDFLRLGATAHYFLNYNAKDQGLKLRAYAGKFFYLKPENGLSAFNFGNAFLSLSGVDGTRDYTYDHYFVGRSEQQGWLSQQLAEEGGFFKVATPMLNEPIGISDNWLAALNLVSDIPDGINPFALLPFKLPVRAFVDVGTYSGAWEENPVTGRFLYDAGLQISVFREALTVYFPLVYSKIYRDTYKSMGDQGSFVHQIRFAIQLGKLKPKVLDRILSY